MVLLERNVVVATDPQVRIRTLVKSEPGYNKIIERIKLKFRETERNGFRMMNFLNGPIRN